MVNLLVQTFLAAATPAIAHSFIHKTTFFLTWGANYTCIFTMITVLFSPAVVTTLCQWSFITSTPYVIHPYCSISLPKSRKHVCFYSSFNSKLSANYVSVCEVPRVITHCSPGSIVKHFHSALQDGICTIDQADIYWEKQIRLTSSSPCIISLSIN